MRIIVRKMKQIQKWKALLVLLLLCVNILSLEASIVTINPGGGEVRYRVSKEDGSWDTWTSYSSQQQTVDVPSGRKIQLRANPVFNNSLYFTKWTGYETKWNYDFNVTVKENRTYTANYTTSTCEFIAEVSQTGGGNVRLEGPLSNTTYSTSVTKTVGIGSRVTMRSQANTGYVLEKWSQNSPDGTVVGYGVYQEIDITSNTARYYAHFSDCWEGTLSSGDYVIENTTGNNFKVNGSGDYPTIGNLTINNNAVVNIKFKTSNYVKLMGTIKCNGGLLNISFVSGTTYPNPTIKRGGGSGDFFNVVNGTLDILGDSGSNQRLVIDGGAVFPDNDARNVYVENVSDFNNHTGSGRLINGGNNGGIVLKNVTLQNAYTFSDGGGIYLYNTQESYPAFKLEDVTIQNCWAPHGSAIKIQSNDRHGTLEDDGAILKRVLIQKCYAKANHNNTDVQGGTIRTNGGGRTKLILDECEICNNLTGNHIYGGYGGAIYWNASGLWIKKSEGHEAEITSITLKNNTKIHDNATYIGSSYTDPATGEQRSGKSWGGALFIESRMFIDEAEIYDNSADVGGGIYLSTYGGGAGDFEGNGFDITVKDGVKIYNNYATNMGGGVFMDIHKSSDLGYNPDGEAISAEFKLSVDGGEIYGNHAQIGGGVAITSNAPKKVMYYESKVKPNGSSSTMVLSGEYQPKVLISDGSIHDNYTDDPNNEGNSCGAGIYIRKYIDDDVLSGLPFSNSGGFTYSDVEGAGTVLVKATGGDVYGNGVHNNVVTTARGGAFYITDEITNQLDAHGEEIESHCIVEITNDRSSSVNIYKNQCTTAGGAIYLDNGDITMDDGCIGGSTTNANKSGGDGGGFYVAEGNVDISGGSIGYNTAIANGGGFYISGGALTISGGTINNNEASANGGGFYVNPGENGITYINSDNANTTINGNKAKLGGGAYVASGSLDIDGTGNNDLVIKGNKATGTSSNQGMGGGVYVAAGSVSVKNATIGASNEANAADVSGGGIYAAGSVNLNEGATVQYNTAASGGGVYVAEGSVEATNATVSSNSATTDDGGGIYAQGTVTINGGSVSANHADSGNGGGIYANAGTNTITVKNGASITGNHAINGAGIYAESGNIDILNSSTISSNQATFDGGALYANGGTVTVNAGNVTFEAVSNNTANCGGGIYANGGAVKFLNGIISSNFAFKQGGGVFISEDATLELMGAAKLTKNHVPTRDDAHSIGQGGGVYLEGVLVVGNATTPSTVKAEDNFAFTTDAPATYEPTDATRSNVFLPEHIASVSDPHKGLITVIEGGIVAEGNNVTHVGFSVLRNKVSVIYCAPSNTNQAYLDKFASGGLYNNVLFDDTHSYTAVHNTGHPYMDDNHVYLYGYWPGIVKQEPANFDQNIINSEEDLAWLISLVNGMNHVGETGYPAQEDFEGQTINLTADLNMSDYCWVPIGISNPDATKKVSFKGTFNGNGHTIKGIDGLSYEDHYGYGLFGDVCAGIIENVILDTIEFRLTDGETDGVTVGSLVGCLESANNTAGTVRNCSVSAATLVSQNPGTMMGGLVGLNYGIIHSCMSVADLSGGMMGGLVGSNCYYLLNCFANPKFTTLNNDVVVGGLAGSSSNMIGNCYVRLRGDEPNKFGWFAGDYAEQISCCYAPSGKTNYVYNPVGTTTFEYNGNYSGTERDAGGKYKFAHSDQQITPGSGQEQSPFLNNEPINNNGELGGLLATLNNTAEALSTGLSIQCSAWTRTMASPINDDLPILLFDKNVAVGSSDGVFIEYATVLDTIVKHFNANTNGGDIYVYNAPGAITLSTDANVRVYIPEDMAIVPDNDNVVINARVGVTLDNSSTGFMAYDWHMFSPVLQAAPMGISYENYGDAHGYGVEIGANDISMTGEGYLPSNTEFNDFDFYTYYEPEYHWINFKRKSGDHWHADGGAEISYQYWNGTDYTSGNEPAMVPGKGYLMAVNQPTMLMADGTLNNGNVTVGVTSVANGYYSSPLCGVNLVGNPYQSYLDYDEFASVNNNKLVSKTYYILDADAGGYISYTPSASKSDVAASQFLHPHQGFFVVVNASTDLTFNNDMRSVDDYEAFRGETPNYPLVSMACTDAEGRNDFATVELDRPEQGGGEKIKGLHAGDASLWFHFDDTDFQTAFTTPGLTTAPLRFKAYEDGTFTLRWGTANGEFNYLHLIDNMTGMDIDCLTTDSYSFEGKTDDYTSRFKLVFGMPSEDDDEDDGASTSSATFAFQMGDELVVNGEGMLQMFDVNGRCLMSTELYGQQNTIALPTAAAGVYVLRLTSGENVKVQKMVVR